MSKIKALQVRFSFLLLLSFSGYLQLIIQEQKFLETNSCLYLHCFLLSPKTSRIGIMINMGSEFTPTTILNYA